MMLDEQCPLPDDPHPPERPGPVWCELYRKHRCPASVRTAQQWKDTIKKTAGRKAKSVYRPGIDREAIETECYTEGLADPGRQIGPGPNCYRFWKKFERTIGACRGKPTKYVYVEVDPSANHFHGWPISEYDLRRKGAIL